MSRQAAAMQAASPSPPPGDAREVVPDAPGYAGPLPELAPARPYAAQVLRATFRSGGAKLGAAWIGIVALMAVFAPFLASSYPLLMKSASRGWSSPLLAHLQYVDIVLLLTFVATLALSIIRKPPFWFPLVAGTAIFALSVALFLPNTGQVNDYSTYREQQAAGTITSVVHAPIAYSPRDRLFSQPYRLQPPHRGHWLGTDENGADVLSQLIHASRVALSIGFVSTGIAVVIGVIVGGVMGYFSGRVDIIGSRILEIVSAIPTLFLLLMAAAVFPRSLYMMMAIIGLTGWVGYARFIRAEFLKLRQQDFVQAAVAAGLPLRSILFRHMLPNGISPVLVSASFGVASAILAESTLSFLGLGLVDDPSWGQLLNQANGISGFHWWIAIFPGTAIFLTVYAYNLIGESLRDALDPRSSRR